MKEASPIKSENEASFTWPDGNCETEKEQRSPPYLAVKFGISLNLFLGLWKFDRWAETPAWNNVESLFWALAFFLFSAALYIIQLRKIKFAEKTLWWGSGLIPALYIIRLFQRQAQGFQTGLPHGFDFWMLIPVVIGILYSHEFMEIVRRRCSPFLQRMGSVHQSLRFPKILGYFFPIAVLWHFFDAAEDLLFFFLKAMRNSAEFTAHSLLILCFEALLFPIALFAYHHRKRIGVFLAENISALGGAIFLHGLATYLMGSCSKQELFVFYSNLRAFSTITSFLLFIAQFPRLAVLFLPSVEHLAEISGTCRDRINTFCRIGFANKERLLIFSIGIILLYLFPLIVLGKDSYVLIHDFLDSILPSMKMLATSGHLFSSMKTLISQPMGGLPAFTFHYFLNVQVWLYAIFDPYTAQLVNQIAMRVTAFLGMYLLFRDHVDDSDSSPVTAAGTALVFTLLPFWPGGGLSVAGQPLAFWAFWNIRSKRDRLGTWLILLLLPLYTSLVLAFAFVLMVLGCIWIWDAINRHPRTLRFLAALATMTLGYVVVTHRLIYAMFLNVDFVSHRKEFGIPFYPNGISETGALIARNFLYGQYHAHSMQFPIVLSCGILAGWLLFWNRKTERALWRAHLGLLFAIGACSFLFGIRDSVFYASASKNFPLLMSFNFSRFNQLHPLLWYIFFGISLRAIIKYMQKSGYLLVGSFILLQIGLLFYQSDFFVEYRMRGMSYRDFFSEDVFSQVKKHIDKPLCDYRVAALGFHPSVLLYNGFFTLDGYFPNYPLSYKKAFRKIIEPELEKNPKNKQYFDQWGSRAYLFSHTFNRSSDFWNPGKKSALKDFHIDVKAFKELGGQYILSSMMIENPGTTGFRFVKKFEAEESGWDIYLYEVL